MLSCVSPGTAVNCHVPCVIVRPVLLRLTPESQAEAELERWAQHRRLEDALTGCGEVSCLSALVKLCAGADTAATGALPSFFGAWSLACLSYRYPLYRDEFVQRGGWEAVHAIAQRPGGEALEGLAAKIPQLASLAMVMTMLSCCCCCHAAAVLLLLLQLVLTLSLALQANVTMKEQMFEHEPLVEGTLWAERTGGLRSGWKSGWYSLRAGERALYVGTRV